MHADVPNHEPSLLLMNCGEARLIRPSLGSWVTYGLGTENQNLPGFIAMCPGGYPIQESQNWQSGVPARRLPGHLHRHASTPTIDKLIENIRNHVVTAAEQRRQLDLLAAAQRTASGDSARPTPQLEARIQSFELAYRMQMRSGRALSTSAASRKHIRDMYGPGVQARQILIARRLLERGVRFVQVWHGARPAVGQPRRSRSQPSPAGRRVRPGDRRPC